MIWYKTMYFALPLFVFSQAGKDGVEEEGVHRTQEEGRRCVAAREGLMRTLFCAVLIGAFVRPCASLDALFVSGAPASFGTLQKQTHFLRTARVRGRACRASAPQQPRPGVLRARAARAFASDHGGNADQALELLKFAFDRMEQRGVTFQQLRIHEQAELHRYALMVGGMQSCSGMGSSTSDLLNEKTASWALTGRWRLVLAPTDMMGLLGLSPAAQVLVDVDSDKNTMVYAVHFRQRWQILEALKFRGSFSLVQTGKHVTGITYQAVGLSIVLLGLTLALPLPLMGIPSASGTISTKYFDGDLWLDRCADGLVVYRYVGPLPADEERCDSVIGVDPVAQQQSVVARARAVCSLLMRALAVATVAAASMLVMVPVIAFVVVAAAAASALHALKVLFRTSRGLSRGGTGGSSSSLERPKFL